MKDALYNLYDTVTGEVFSYGVTLNQREASVFNYAFALNGTNKRYILEKDMPYIPQA